MGAERRQIRDHVAGRLSAATRRRWVLPASLLAHAVILALLILTIHRRPPPEVYVPPGIALVFRGGATKAAAPKAPRRGPPQRAQAPAPPPMPPPAVPRIANPAPVPPLPPHPTPPRVSALPAPSPPAPAVLAMPLPPPAAPPAPALPAPPRPKLPGAIVMNRFSFGTRARSAPPSRGLNLSLSRSDLNPLGPSITFKGKVGQGWESAFSAWVERHKYYPRAAGEMGQQGDVTVHLVVGRNGHVRLLRLLKSSGAPLLDMAWFGLFRDARLPPFPPGTKASSISIDATMHFFIIH